MLWIAITLLILGLFGAAILRRHLHEAKLFRLREIAHRERMAAMEHNLPVPEAGTTEIDSMLAKSEGYATNPDRTDCTSVQWLRLVSLALGLTCLFGGLGLLPGFYYLADEEASGMWPIGLIPIFIGVGLLIFVRLSKGLNGGTSGMQESR